MIESNVKLIAVIDGEDIVKGLKKNDDAVLQFITEMLLEADSLELREQLMQRLIDWDSQEGEDVQVAASTAAEGEADDV